MMHPTVVLMAGLPASGKTTTAERIHASAGGVLIRSCDVWADLGISLPDWVRQTCGFTQNVGAYERLRDEAYREMARRLERALASGAQFVIVDAVHGEPDKRAEVYRVCAEFRATPLVLWCRCDDFEETRRRFAGREGRDHEPPNEASDLAVFRHIASLWKDPVGDRTSTGEEVPVAIIDTV
jgi:predicted kinase